MILHDSQQASQCANFNVVENIWEWIWSMTLAWL